MREKCIESKLHELLIGIDPLNKNYNEQAYIIALANSMLNNNRYASSNKLMKESMLMDAILDAISLVENYKINKSSRNDKYYTLDDPNLSYNQIINAVVARNSYKKFAQQDIENILNDENIDSFILNNNENDSNVFDFDDAVINNDEENNEYSPHPTSVFEVKGKQKHTRTDSIIR